LIIFCISWAASVSVFSMRSPPAHIWTYCMQLGVREKCMQKYITGKSESWSLFN
jgi:hypothetical protein